jgi:SAM-dependent methyltransferase
MKPRLLDWLACPACGNGLHLEGERRDGAEIVDGTLACAGCAAAYPIVRGIPRLLPPSLSTVAAATAERFGYEWSRFAEIRPAYEAQFRGWLAPFDPAAFAGRTVLDAGCGKGRHLRLAARFGARDVIGIDLGDSIEVSARNTADLPGVHLVQGDLTRPPIRSASVDIVYSIGVLHHLADPDAGFRALGPLVVPGGSLLAWVYAREGNEGLLGLLEPVRRVTRRLPLPVVRALAWPPAAAVTAAVRAVYGRSRLHGALPYASYLRDLSAFPLREIHSIVFDQLLAPVAHYMPRRAVEGCVRQAGLELCALTWHHENSWAAWAQRPALAH